ncbi:MAG: hypothetical protein ACXVLQ_04715 [Bacteriovorax sp.]
MHEQKEKIAPMGSTFIVPINVVVFSLKNFWNIKRLFSLFPQKEIRRRFIMSILTMNLFFMVIVPRIPKFWNKFLLSYVLFLVIAELYLKVITRSGIDVDNGACKT